MFLKNAVAALLVALCSAAWSAPAFESAHALVIDQTTGQVLYEKNADQAAPIASMTKLMTAMVVLDSQANPFEVIAIADDDWDRIKGTKSGVPTGAMFTRRTLLELALMSSDNHAAHALARTYPGGIDAFLAAMQRKIAALGLEGTRIGEPTGLSPNNQATAHDMAKIVRAASAYPDIVAATSQRSKVVLVNGKPRTFHNTNGLVGAPGWDVSVSKTGFIQEAGRCLSMQIESAGRKVLVVLMGARDSAERTLDALNIHRLLNGQPTTVLAKAATPRTVTKTVAKGSARHARPKVVVALRKQPGGKRA